MFSLDQSIHFCSFLFWFLLLLFLWRPPWAHSAQSPWPPLVWQGCGTASAHGWCQGGCACLERGLAMASRLGNVRPWSGLTSPRETQEKPFHPGMWACLEDRLCRGDELRLFDEGITRGFLSGPWLHSHVSCLRDLRWMEGETPGEEEEATWRQRSRLEWWGHKPGCLEPSEAGRGGDPPRTSGGSRPQDALAPGFQPPAPRARSAVSGTRSVVTCYSSP